MEITANNVGETLKRIKKFFKDKLEKGEFEVSGFFGPEVEIEIAKHRFGFYLNHSSKKAENLVHRNLIFEGEYFSSDLAKSIYERVYKGGMRGVIQTKEDEIKRMQKELEILKNL